MDADDYRESADLFVTVAPGLARELRALTVAGDLARVRMLAHRLVGTIGFFDPGASDAARRLEEAASEGRLTDVAALAVVVDAELGTLVKRLMGPEGEPMTAKRNGAHA